jgi:hypothetical protein
VPQIRVENLSDRNVLLVEGETLEGAKQNRTLNTSVLIGAKSGAKSEVDSPVSCVEAGRWHHSSVTFAAGKHYSHSKLRRLESHHAMRTLTSSGSYAGSRGAIWNEISDKAAFFRKVSPTSAVDDLYDSVEEDQKETAEQESAGEPRPDFRELLEGARGMVLMTENRHFIVDLFDKRSTFARYRDRLVRAAIFEAMSSPEVAQPEK